MAFLCIQSVRKNSVTPDGILSINPNENSILTRLSPVPDVVLEYTLASHHISNDYRQDMPMAGVLEVHIPTAEIRSPRSRTLAPIPWRGLQMVLGLT